MPFVTKRYLELLESQVEEFKKLWQEERERADRLHDELLAQRGLNPATQIGIVTQQRKEAEEEERTKTMRKEMAELFGEQVDIEAMPSSLQADAERFVKGF